MVMLELACVSFRAAPCQLPARKHGAALDISMRLELLDFDRRAGILASARIG